MGGVLRVALAERGDGRPVGGLVGADKRAEHRDLDVREPAPVLVPPVDEDRRAGVGPEVLHSPKRGRVRGSLGLLVERGPERIAEEGVADRHRPRSAVAGVDRGERGASRLGQELAEGVVKDRVDHSPTVDSPGMTQSDTAPTRHVSSARIVAVRGRSLEVRADRVTAEEPLEIRAAGPHQEPVAVAVTMRTPGDEDELAVGFLRTEGLIDGTEVRGVRFGDPATRSAPDDTVIVQLDRPFDASRVAERHFVATASCGICGKASIDEVALRVEPIPEGPVVRLDVILALPDLLRAAQAAFEITGGLHGVGLFTPAGELLAVREDVGRHNALDKLVGSQVLARAMPLHERVLMVSGRVSFEIVQKAAAAGIPIVCAVSAPSSLAIDAAERLGVTLVGFLRGDGFNIYTHDGRIDLHDLRRSP